MDYREIEKRNTNAIHAEKRELELYFHIPFCIRKCHYCDFLSAPADRETIGRYMEALLAETEGSALSYGEYTVPTVFIGGGTPSVAAVEDMERLLAAVGRRYRLEQDAEITMEVNPGTVSKGQLRTLRKAGVNRLSIGLQSAEDRELAAIGRIHTWKQFADTYEQARSAGFENINVDIMSALPGQTLPGYKRTLERILSLEPPPEHISAYSLILEEGTPEEVFGNPREARGTKRGSWTFPTRTRTERCTRRRKESWKKMATGAMRYPTTQNPASHAATTAATGAGATTRVLAWERPLWWRMPGSGTGLTCRPIWPIPWAAGRRSRF